MVPLFEGLYPGNFQLDNVSTGWYLVSALQPSRSHLGLGQERRTLENKTQKHHKKTTWMEIKLMIERML